MSRESATSAEEELIPNGVRTETLPRTQLIPNPVELNHRTGAELNQTEVNEPQAEQTDDQKATVCLRKNDRIKFRENGVNVTATVTGRASKAKSKYKNWYNIVRDDSTEGCSIDLGSVEFIRLNENEAQVFLAVIPKNEQETKV